MGSASYSLVGVYWLLWLICRVRSTDPVDICELSDVMGIPVSYLPCRAGNRTVHETATEPSLTGRRGSRRTLEDPDMFTTLRISLAVMPQLARYTVEDPMRYYDVKVMFAYRFMLRNQSCDFAEYSQVMPQFWTEYFEGTADGEESEQFGYHFWNVSVKFEPDATNATIPGHCGGHHRIIDCTVQKNAQLMRERSLCFSGGLLECSNETQTCICLSSHGTETIRVNHTTGKPDPVSGTACFVKEGHPCLVKHFGAADLKLPCANKFVCDTYTGNCQREITAY